MAPPSIHDRLLKMEHQVGRLVADAESEKATRARVNMDFEARLRKLEKGFYTLMGICIVIQIAIGVVLTLIKR